ncbi:response regulator receiver sensor signal transduction histidine kinase [hydrothermal vent metagenome]|uniref:histidine kinase n=1 Tax=hydrothermal vent metagenome TaxID=652676 RepID=A0A1W1EA85_9ZZZZ
MPRDFHAILPFLLSLFLWLQTANAGVMPVTVTPTQYELSLLSRSEVCFDNNRLAFREIKHGKCFKPYGRSYINTGIQTHTIWIRFRLENPTDTPVERALVLTSPLLEYIALYIENDQESVLYNGVDKLQENRETLVPYYMLTLPPHTVSTFYLEIRSLFTPVEFTLMLKEKKHFLAEDRRQQFMNILLVGFILALATYSLILFFYIGDRSYLYYSMYLFALVWQQMTYLGLTHIYLSPAFVSVDMKIPVLKINLLVVTSTLFAMHFLKVVRFGRLWYIYMLFIVVSLLEILLLSTPLFYNLYVVIFTGALFITFNLAAGIISYRRGEKQARLFIAGFAIVFLSYLFIILDAVGITTFMLHVKNILMFGTAFEALVLSLAFADRYRILQHEKAVADAQILDESRRRTELVEKDVEAKTAKLNEALKAKELLLQEVHHRVKNNLQIILSIIRMQHDTTSKTQSTTEMLSDLENRINAIAQTYNMLLVKERLEEIDMQEYLETLLHDLQRSLQNNKTVHITLRTNAIMPLRQSVYVGLIINELITNAYKYAFSDEGTITVTLLQEEKRFILTVEDDGRGLDSAKTEKSLGLQLVETLALNQLGGKVTIKTEPHTTYTIRFTL